MATHNSDDAEAAFLNAMKALQELENTQNALGDVNDRGMNEEGTELLRGARESTEMGGSESGDGARELSAHEDEDEDDEEDNLLKTPASEEVSPAAAPAVSSPKTGPSSVGASTNGRDSAHHLDYSPADVVDGGATQDSSARSSSRATPAAQGADAAAADDDDDGAYVPDENISDRSPPPISISTDITASSHNVDSLPVSAFIPTPPASALSAPAPIVSAHNLVQKGAAAFTATNKRKRLPQDIVGQLEDRIAEDPRGDIDAWMTLIEEHRKKGKLDEARAVYERFFVVFPAAVGLQSYLFPIRLDFSQLLHLYYVPCVFQE